MPIFKARHKARFYGHAIGIIMLDCIEPNIPGDVGNASSYSYPVLFRPVPGLTPQAALTGDLNLAEAVIDAALELEQLGVKGISANCGFLLHHQENVSRAVKVPVMLSSLLMLPLIASSIGNKASIGMITADSKNLTQNLLKKANPLAETSIHILGLENKPEFQRVTQKTGGILNSRKFQDEVVQLAVDLKNHHPNIGAILLECSLLPPYAHAVQVATGLPVFDFISMINLLEAATHQKGYQGLY